MGADKANHRKAGLIHMTRTHGGCLIIPAEKRPHCLGPRVIKYSPSADREAKGWGDNDFIYASRLACQITSEDCSRYRGEESHQGSSPLITHRAALAVTSPPCLLSSVEYRSSIPKIFHVKNFQIKMQNLTDQTAVINHCSC